jgi:hypothetical protein
MNRDVCLERLRETTTNFSEASWSCETHRLMHVFIFRMCEMRDHRDEMPADFDNEIHKWSLECK